MTGQEVFDVLSARGVTKLFHANSIPTSVSQLRLGGLASRQKVEQSQLPQTCQYTDNSDQNLGVWNDIFLDTVDIHARISSRNQYGPVLFEIDIAILLALPNPSSILVTRSNPSKWSINTSNEDRYFLNSEQLSFGLQIGNFDHMLLIRTPVGLVPFANQLQKIVLDEPRLSTGESKEHITGKDVLLTAACGSGVQVDIIRRHCISTCHCISSYTPDIISKFF